MEGLIAVNEEEIRRIAYDLWEREGRPRGRELDHYYKAEQLAAHDRLASGDSSIALVEQARPADAATSAVTSDAATAAKPARRSVAKKAATKPRSKRA